MLDYVSENNTFAHITMFRRETDREEKHRQRKRQTDSDRQTDRDKHRGKVIETDTERGKKG